MSTITTIDQLQVDKSAQEYVALHHLKIALQLSRERTDQLHKAIMSAQMHLSIGDSHRAYEILTQALTS